MPEPRWRLTVTRSFSGSHQLRNYGGKCERMHGHNFTVDVTVEGSELDPDVEYLVDFKVLKTMTDEILDAFDHHHLNEVEPFTTCNPSSENIARHIYQKLAARLAETAPNVTVAEVTVAEKPGQKATYFEV